jgi:hypothetical protein
MEVEFFDSHEAAAKRLRQAMEAADAGPPGQVGGLGQGGALSSGRAWKSTSSFAVRPSCGSPSRARAADVSDLCFWLLLTSLVCLCCGCRRVESRE